MGEEVEIVLKGKFENGKLLIDTTEKIDENVKKIGKDAQKTDDNVGKLRSGLKKLAAVVGIGLVVKSFGNMVKASLKAAGAMEQVDIALTTMLGSAEKAAQLQKDLIEFAKKTPFEIEGIFQTTKQLLAYGVAQENIISTMNTLGNIASGVGVDMNRLALVFGQVRSTGKLLGQDLNQFTQAGVPLLAELATLLGKTEAEVIKLKENGQISFDLVKQALQNMTAEGGRFYNLMENQSKTFLGTLSNMADSFFQVKTALGNALLPAAKRFVAFMLPALDKTTKYIEQNAKSITKFAQSIVTGLIYIGKAFKAVFSVLGFFTQIIEDIAVAFYIFTLEVTRGFKELKVTIFDFVESVLNKLSLLSSLPMFGWIDDVKQDFSSMKNSIIKDIDEINDEISNIKAVQAESRVSVSSDVGDVPEIPQVGDSVDTQQTMAVMAEDPGVVEKKRLKALKEENAELLAAQAAYLTGRNAQETEADEIAANNKLLGRQQELLSQGEFAARKEELDQQLLDNEISLDEYKQELALMNNEAELAAIQEQFEAKLAQFEENQMLMDETKLMMQQTTDEAELMQLQNKLNQQKLAQQENNVQLVAMKVKLEKAKAKEETKADKFRNFMSSKEVKTAERGAAALVQLQNSKNKEMAAIGKAAAIFQIGMDTAKGAMSAYSAMAMIPIVGPVLGAVAAAAVIAYGAEQMSAAKSNSFAVGTPNIPQDQMANVHKGEMIVPATFSDAIRSGELSLSAAGNIADNIIQPEATITNINISFEGTQFVGQMDDEDIEMIGERLGQLIAEDVIPSLPTKEV